MSIQARQAVALHYWNAVCSKRWVWCMVLIMLSGNGSRLIAGEILIVNSDQAIAKYTQAQIEFSRHFTQAPVVLDLGAGQLNDEDIEGMVFEADPRLVYCIGQKACLTASKLGLARSRPMVFSAVINWRALLSNKNFRGIAPDLPVEVQLTLFRYFFPQMKTLGVLYSKQYTALWLQQTQRTAATLSIAVRAVAVTESTPLSTALASVVQNTDALWLIADPIVLSNQSAVRSIFGQASQAKKAVLAYDESFMAMGAALALGVDTPTIARQAAALAQQILQGQIPAEQVQHPAGSQVTINLTVVKQSGLLLNEEALSSAHRIIE